MQNAFRVDCYLSSTIMCMRGYIIFFPRGGGPKDDVFMGRSGINFWKFYFVNLLYLNFPGVRTPLPLFSSRRSAHGLYTIYSVVVFRSIGWLHNVVLAEVFVCNSSCMLHSQIVLTYDLDFSDNEKYILSTY